MGTKFNEETQNRPFGTRFTDSDILKIDLPSYIMQLNAEESWKDRDRNAITVFKSEKVTITLIALSANAKVVPGNFEGTGIMSLQIISGVLNFTNGVNTINLTTGQLVTVHEHVPFSAFAVEDSVCLLTMIK